MRDLGGMDQIGLTAQLEYLGPCEIEGQLFDLGAYPGLRPGPGRVRGEIHRLLDPEAIPILDRFEDFEPDAPEGSLYIRRQIRLIEPKRTDAWIYFYNRDLDSDRQIEAGDWRAYLESRTNT